ncbi:MAG: hypothetical protein E4H42_04700 [Chromatiales bacterium]|nr:MAG: hypothetical protein E4H42_04700 [Chromatiales bacterium]
MIRIIAIIVAAALMGGCVTESKISTFRYEGEFRDKNEDNNCDGKGKSEAVIQYGDSYVSVTPKTESKRKGEIIFTLKPEKNSSSGIDYEALEITIEGKQNKDKWLDTKGKASDKNKTIFVCVDENLAYGPYDYLVKVPGVGAIDPRVEVTH